MPPSGAEARAEQRATLNRIAHELNVSPDLGELLEELRSFEEEHDFESFEAGLIRVARRDYEKAVRVPPDLRAEMTRAGSLGYQGWLRAREQEELLPDKGLGKPSADHLRSRQFERPTNGLAGQGVDAGLPLGVALVEKQ